MSPANAAAWAGIRCSTENGARSDAASSGSSSPSATARSVAKQELLEEVAANEAQREEWVGLHAIDEIEKDLTRRGYSLRLIEDDFHRRMFADAP